MITGKKELEEKFESSQNNILKLIALQGALLLSSGGLNNELTLTMQNIDATQATTEELRANKK